MTRPLVSVTLPVFNNERHLACAIQSVLDQTMNDLELVIVDDGSSDRSAEIVRRFDDRRIVFHQQENQGGAAATNRAVEAASGRWIAHFAGDDVCHPRRLERQLQHIEETGRRASFTWVNFIDDEGAPVTSRHFASGWFNHPQRSRAEMVHWFFRRGNYLCTPSALIERGLLLDSGLYCLTDAQVPDLRMWFALLRTEELPVLEERLLDYRIRMAEGNVSGPANARRAYLELTELYREQLPLLPDDLFREAFAEELRHRGFSGDTERRLEEAFLFASHPISSVRLVGIAALHTMLRDPATLAVAETRYRFGLRNLHNLANGMELFAATELVTYRARMQEAYENFQREHHKVEEFARGVLAARDRATEEYAKLDAYTRRVLAEKDRVSEEYRKLDAYTRRVLAEKDRVSEEYRKLDAYTREVLAEKQRNLVTHEGPALERASARTWRFWKRGEKSPRSEKRSVPAMHVKTAAEWVHNRDALLQELRRFALTMRTRPFDNEQGLRGVSAFALYWFVRRVAPRVVFEVGVWRGFSTWLIEQAAPSAEIHSFDPLFLLEGLLRNDALGEVYRSPRARYSYQDFSCAPIGALAAGRSEALAFFDDHQNKLPRLRQCRELGIRHVIFDDNLAAPYTHRTLEHERAADASELDREIELYETFPALWPVDFRVGDLHVKEEGMNFPVEPELQELYEERQWHSYVTYVRLRERS
ncbi:MAG: glycosyltransferase family 2 protein [Acidobacteria bacterium]|nr:glycosyltransferase family 2 protein [Acidobacteriota bacterium]